MSTAARLRTRLAPRLLGLGLSVLLAACGPGTGGTGTGEAAGLLGAAQPQALCSSNLASALDCPGDASLATAGSARVVFVGDAGTLLLVIEGNHARLQSGCPAIAFEGRFSRLDDGSTRFVGEARSGQAGSPGTLAGLEVTPQPDRAGALDLELIDADAVVLLSRRRLQRIAASAEPPAPPPCD